jgi:hypothetical protein
MRIRYVGLGRMESDGEPPACTNSPGTSPKVGGSLNTLAPVSGSPRLCPAERGCPQDRVRAIPPSARHLVSSRPSPRPGPRRSPPPHPSCAENSSLRLPTSRTCPRNCSYADPVLLCQHTRKVSAAGEVRAGTPPVGMTGCRLISPDKLSCVRLAAALRRACDGARRAGWLTGSCRRPPQRRRPHRLSSRHYRSRRLEAEPPG